MEDVVTPIGAAPPSLRFDPIGTTGACLIHPVVRGDDRGHFARSWCADSFADAAIRFTPVQGNTSLTRHRHSVRGMHFQRAPRQDAKIVRCSRGAIHDVIVDLRPGSPTCGQWFANELSADNAVILYVPEGFAHGFQTLEDDTIVEYLMGAAYDGTLYDGFRHDDPLFGIAWPEEAANLSPADCAWPDAAGRMPWIAAA